MKPSRYDEIQELVDRFGRLSDADFLAALTEHGVDTSELSAFTREREKRERVVRLARRGMR